MKKINTFLITIISCFSLIYLLLNFNNLSLSQILIVLSLIPVVLGIKIVRKIFKLKIEDGTELIYLLFIISTQIVGSIFNGYDLIDYYDKFVHFISGALSSIFALTLLNNTKLKNRTIVIDIIFILTFALSIASLWEFCEFTFDNILNEDAQNVITSGVTDTMLDMMSALLASIIFSIIYYYKAHKLVKN